MKQFRYFTTGSAFLLGALLAYVIYINWGW